MKLEKCKCGLTNWGLKNTPLTQYLYCLCCSTPYPDRTEELEKEKIEKEILEEALERMKPLLPEYHIEVIEEMLEDL